MEKTKISTFDSTWNPVTGCLHGCEYCYARGIAERFGTLFKGDILPEDEGLDFFPDEPVRFLELDEPARGENGKIEPYPANFYPTFHRYKLNDYIEKKGRNIFVCSMADLFGSWVPDSWIEDVFAACEKAPQHNYLFLTKNPQRYVDLGYTGKLPEKKNMWYGTTVTGPNKPAYYGKGFNTFWSIEPILESFGSMGPTYNECPKWVIMGAETGNRKGKIIPKREWIENIVNECKKAGLPLFMKSSLAEIWGEPLIQEFPEGLRGVNRNMKRLTRGKQLFGDNETQIYYNKLKEYEDLEEQLYQIYGECDGLLESIIDSFVKHDGIDLPEPVFKARLLTDGMVDKWEEYKRLEEQKKLWKLPCVVGDTVYWVNDWFYDGKIGLNHENHITESKVSKFIYDSKGIWIRLKNGEKISVSEFGKTVFITHEEAEAALQKMKVKNQEDK